MTPSLHNQRLDGAKTYDEWNALGFSPYKGQKHTGRNAHGICTFLPNQVGLKPKPFVEQEFQRIMNRNIRDLQKDYMPND